VPSQADALAGVSGLLGVGGQIVAVILIIVLIIVALIWMNAAGKAKARMHYANERGAERDTQSGLIRKPTWIDTPKEKIFFEQVVDIAQKKGVSRTFVMKGFMSPDAAEALFSHVAHMEARGSSFTEQVIAGGDYVSDAWGQLPGHAQEGFTSKDKLGVVGLFS